MDHLASWEHEITLKIRDAQHVNSELLVGASLLEKTLKNASKEDKKAIQEAIKAFRDEKPYN